MDRRLWLQRTQRRWIPAPATLISMVQAARRAPATLISMVQAARRATAGMTTDARQNRRLRAALPVALATFLRRLRAVLPAVVRLGYRRRDPDRRPRQRAREFAVFDPADPRDHERVRDLRRDRVRRQR